MDQFVSLVLSSGPIGLVVGLFILLAIFGADKAGLVVTGDQKRIANIVLGVLIAGVPLISSGVDHAALAAAIASVGSALVSELLKLIFASKPASAKSE